MDDATRRMRGRAAPPPPADPPPHEAPAEPPDRRYTIDRPVGRGGMGEVFAVRDAAFGRELAMKRISAEVATEPDLVRRFLDEARITARLDHPGVVPVHDRGVDDDGRAWFTMRLVRGRTFWEVVALARTGQEGWSIVRAVGVLVRVCETMAFAHARGVIHRDLKPSNVRIGDFGETYVLDWGAARLDSDPPEAPGTVLGTPAWMAPEQAGGEPVDARADVYAAGAMLYALLTGAAPYPVGGAPEEAVGRVLAGPPVPVQALDRRASPELVAVCEKAMARRPADRYADMGELADELRRFLEGRVVRAFDTGAVAELRKWVGRNRPFAAALATLVVLAFGGAVLVASLEARQARIVREEEARTAAARDAAMASEAEARAQGCRANLVAADTSLRLADAAEARTRLAACPTELRGWEWRHLLARTDTAESRLAHPAPVTALASVGDALVTGAADGSLRLWRGGEARVLTGHADAVSAIVPFGDGFASAGRDGAVTTWDARGERIRSVATDGVAVHALAARGDTLAAGLADGRVLLWNASGERVLRGHTDAVGALAFVGPDRLASGSRDRTVREWDLRSGREIARFIGHADEVTALLAGEDGVLWSGSLDRTVRRWRGGMARGAGGRPEEGAPEATFVGMGPVHAMAWADGAIAVGGFDRAVRLLDPASGMPARVLLGHEGPVRALALSAGHVVSASDDGTIRRWSGEGPVASRRLGANTSAIATSPDGRRVAIALEDGTIFLRDVATGVEIFRFAAHAGEIGALAFDAAGTRLVSGGWEDAEVRVWDATNGDSVATLAGHEASVADVAFSPDGRRVWSASADGRAMAWDAATGAELRILRHDGAVQALAVDPRGELVATATADGRVHSWDATSGVETGAWQAHAAAITALAWAPDGIQLATASSDRTAKVWDRAGTEAIPLEGHESGVSGLAWLDGGARLATASFDGTARVWSPDGGPSLLVLRDASAPLLALASSGTHLWAGAADGTLTEWK